MSSVADNVRNQRPATEIDRQWESGGDSWHRAINIDFSAERAESSRRIMVEILERADREMGGEGNEERSFSFLAARGEEPREGYL